MIPFTQVKRCLFMVLCACSVAPLVGQTFPFKFQIVKVEFNNAPGSDRLPLITYKVIDANGLPVDILDQTNQTIWHQPARIFMQIGWDTRDYTNTGSQSNLAPATLPNTAAPPGASLPIPVNARDPLSVISRFVIDGTFQVKSKRPVPLTAQGTGVVAMEGRLARFDATTSTWVAQPVKSVFMNFAITGTTITPRRTVVDVNKCKGCHPTHMVSTHGNNRTDEIQVCVICHNPNNTDIAWRMAKINGVAVNDGPEVPIDFKRLIHGIHSSKMRTAPYVVVGFQHSINNFSFINFPKSLADCQACHFPGTNALPLKPNVLGSTVKTWSRIEAEWTSLGGIFTKYNFVDGDPSNDLKISPTAAVCSACHDGREVRGHMEQNGAQFAALQSQMNNPDGTPRERCANCHGIGKGEDVVRVHAEEAAESSH